MLPTFVCAALMLVMHFFDVLGQSYGSCDTCLFHYDLKHVMLKYPKQHIILFLVTHHDLRKMHSRVHVK